VTNTTPHPLKLEKEASMQGTHIVWVHSDAQLDGIGSGIRRVRYKDHPTRKGYVKIYPMHEGYPKVMGRAEFEELVLDDYPAEVER
jgi:hypothetical protein